MNAIKVNKKTRISCVLCKRNTASPAFNYVVQHIHLKNVHSHIAGRATLTGLNGDTCTFPNSQESILFAFAVQQVQDCHKVQHKMRKLGIFMVSWHVPWWNVRLGKTYQHTGFIEILKCQRNAWTFFIIHTTCWSM